jgi:hypothetical protein
MFSFLVLLFFFVGYESASSSLRPTLGPTAFPSLMPSSLPTTLFPTVKGATRFPSTSPTTPTRMGVTTFPSFLPTRTGLSNRNLFPNYLVSQIELTSILHSLNLARGQLSATNMITVEWDYELEAFIYAHLDELNLMGSFDQPSRMNVPNKAQYLFHDTCVNNPNNVLNIVRDRINQKVCYPVMITASLETIACVLRNQPGPYGLVGQSNSFTCFGRIGSWAVYPYAKGTTPCTQCPSNFPLCVNNLCS